MNTEQILYWGVLMRSEGQNRTKRLVSSVHIPYCTVLYFWAVWAPDREEPAGRSALVHAPVSLIFLLFFILP